MNHSKLAEFLLQLIDIVDAMHSKALSRVRPSMPGVTQYYFWWGNRSRECQAKLFVRNNEVKLNSFQCRADLYLHMR